MVIPMKTPKHSSLAEGAALMAVSAVVVKLIGMCYKIPLLHLLGAQGMGYFNAAYDVYALLCVISTTGLPVAVSVVMNRYPHEKRRIYLLSLIIFTLLGLPGAAGVFFGADRIALWIGAPEAAQSLRFIAPAVLFICLSGAFRGYYQAMRNMMPTAISQVIEAAGKLLFGLVFAHISLRLGATLPVAAAYAVLGLSVGTLLSFLYLVLCSHRGQNVVGTAELSNGQLLRQLLVVAFPVTLGAVLAGFSKVIDLSLIMRRLQESGMEQGMAVTMYGCYSSMVIPLFNVIPALFGAVATPLVPHLVHAIAKGDTSEQTQILSNVFRWCAAFSIPASLGMAILSQQILQVLFFGSKEIPTAVPLLIIACMSVPASCMITASSAVLQAYGKAWLPMLSTAIGCVVKAVSLYALCVIPEVGILAAPISTWLCCTAIVCINLAHVSKVAPHFDFPNQFIIALLASTAAVGVASIVHRMMLSHVESLALRICATMATAILIYLPIAYKCDLLRISDIKSITSYKEKET